MKSKRKEEPYPLKLVNNFAKNDPEIWQVLESLQKRMENEAGGKIDTLSLAEIGRAYLEYKEEKKPSGLTPNHMTSFGLEIASLFRWRKDKIYLDYDPAMAHELYMQENDLNIPSKVLSSLPYDCFYMTLPGIDAKTVFGFENTNIKGVFVTREKSEKTSPDARIPSHPASVRFCIVGNHGKGKEVPFTANFILAINENTIEENLPFKIINGKNQKKQPKNTQGVLSLYRKLITLVMYACARNTDITRKPGTEKRTKRTGEIKDRYFEVEEYDVGARIASALKINTDIAETSPLTDGMIDPGYSQPPVQDDEYSDENVPIMDATDDKEKRTQRKSAHIRRGHWHHYWTGPRSDPDNRVPILHWLPPTAVGIKLEEAPVPTIRPVIPKKKQR